MSPTTMPAFDRVSTPQYQTLPAWTELDHPQGIEDVLKKIALYERLPRNWDSYQSGPVNRDAVLAAVRLLALAWRYLDHGRTPEVAPIGGGGIHLAFTGGRSRSIEIEVLPDGGLVALQLQDDEPVGDDIAIEPTREDVEAVLRWL